MNKNISLFSQRFPALAQHFHAEFETFRKKECALPFTIQCAKNGSPTALENGKPLHSLYNPEREAAQLVSSFDKKNEAAVFFSCGLGYAPCALAAANARLTLMIVEPDVRYLLAAFSALDWETVLLHPHVIFALGAKAQDCAALVERLGTKNIQYYRTATQSAHADAFFDEVAQQISQRNQKAEINTNTLEKFAHLWLSNSCRNLHYIAELDGIEKYRGLSGTLPFVVLAAGPSLQRVLPALGEIKKRSIIVCVDTALHACLAAGVEPDFLVLVDPQYVCARHLDFLSAPSSILITESAVWPSVFRFKCKRIELCSSMFPIGQFFEKRLGQKGALGAGGSVTTTAWDFARHCGATRIYLAGMDLGFPGKQTHIKGSQFEERAHRLSGRLCTAEQDNVKALLSASPASATDYTGSPILTDRRMALFSWWFETNCAAARQNGQETFSLTAESLAITGIKVEPPESLCMEPERIAERKHFFAEAEKRSSDMRASKKADGAPSFLEIKEQFVQSLQSLSHTAKRGISLCTAALSNRSKAPAIISQLSELDRSILNSSGKDAAALVFPTERQLEALSKDLPSDPHIHSLMYSRLIYQELQKAANAYLEALDS